MRVIEPGDRAYPISQQVVNSLLAELITMGDQLPMPDLVVVAHMLVAVAQLTAGYLSCSATKDKSPENICSLMNAQKEMFNRAIDAETQELLAMLLHKDKPEIKSGYVDTSFKWTDQQKKELREALDKIFGKGENDNGTPPRNPE